MYQWERRDSISIISTVGRMRRMNAGCRDAKPEVLEGISVAHPAAEAKKFTLFNFPKHTTAIGTGERRRMTQAIFA